MKIDTVAKDPFTVIGKEGSTSDGAGFIAKLWAEADSHFDEIAHLAKKDADGALVGLWGAMTDPSRSFLPWEEGFARGLYLAGAECVDGAQAPEGWAKWILPAFEYLRVEQDGEGTFARTLQYMQDNGLPLVGAVQDFTCPRTGKDYMLFPIHRL